MNPTKESKPYKEKLDGCVVSVSLEEVPEGSRKSNPCCSTIDDVESVPKVEEPKKTEVRGRT